LNRFRNLWLGIAAGAALTAPLGQASANADIKILIDGEAQVFSQMPILENGTTLVPMRGVFQALGAEVAWNEAAQTVTAESEYATVELSVELPVALVNGEPVVMAVPPKIVGGSTLVPLRFVSEALGAEVDWDAETSTITIVRAPERPPEPPRPPVDTDALLGEIESLMGEAFFGEGALSEAAEEGIVVDEETYLTKYRVFGEDLKLRRDEEVDAALTALQEDEETQLEVWALFRSMFPGEYLQDVSEFGFYTDGVDGMLAYVTQLPYNPSRWSVNVDLQDVGHFPTLAATLAHEYAHLLSLNERELRMRNDLISLYLEGDIPEDYAASCRNLYIYEGCARKDSYINRFYEAFWEDSYDEWEREVGWDGDEDAVVAYYESYEDRFVNDYAATNVVEDFAESFTYYVFSPKPATESVYEVKQLFFYEFPELVRLREDILRGVKAYLESYEET